MQEHIYKVDKVILCVIILGSRLRVMRINLHTFPPLFLLISFYFLLQSFHTVKCIKKAIFNSELGYSTLENLNKALFDSQFIPNANSLTQLHFRDDHLKNQLWPDVWLTQVELMVIATLFQVPVYCCYTWNQVPLGSYRTNSHPCQS